MATTSSINNINSMASISNEKLVKDIKEILKGADLSNLSSKKIRKKLEEKYGFNLDSKKSEIDAMVMKAIQESQEEDDDENDESDAEQNGSKTSESEESDFDEPIDNGPPVKKAKKMKQKSDGEDDEELARKLQEEEDTGKRRTRGGKKPQAAATKTKKSGNGTKRANNRYMQKLSLSPALAEIVGEEQMARSDVVKKMWEIIKERNLQDPKQKQFMLCDDQLLPIFGRKRVKTFGMMKYLKDHMFNEDA